MLICLLLVVICLFPAVWVFLASFKDIKEFTRNVTIFPESFEWSRIADTWNAFNFPKYYTNSLISVVGSVVCAVVFNGLLAYGLGVLKPKGHKIALGLVMWSLMIPATTSVVALFRNINLIGLKGSFLPLGWHLELMRFMWFCSSSFLRRFRENCWKQPDWTGVECFRFSIKS